MPPLAERRSRWHRALGLKASLLLGLLPCVGAVLIVDNWVDYRSTAEQIQQAYDQSLVEPAQALIDSVSASHDGVHMEMPFAVNSMFAATSSHYKQLAVSVSWQGTAGAHGTLGEDGLYHRQLLGDAALPPPPASALTPASPVFYDADYNGRPFRIAAIERVMTVEQTDYRVRVLAAEGMGARDEALAVVWQQTLLRDTWQLVSVILLVWLSVGWTLRPLNRLRDALRARSGQPLVTPLETAAVPHEVRPLVEVINQHIWARQAAVDAQASFLADASHQLRMPLAIMFAQVRYALRESDPARMRETFEAILGQLDHSRRLAEQLLSLAHATQAEPDAVSQRVDLSAVARDVVLQYLGMAHDKDIDLGWQAAASEAGIRNGSPCDEGRHATRTETSGEPAVPVMASEVEIHEVIANLVHNAIRYTPIGGCITVSVSCEAMPDGPWVSRAGEPLPRLRACVSVVDDGPGIAPERRAQAFDRFQRHAHPEVNGRTRGAGLGLSIARAYARRQGGDIELHDADPAARERAAAPGLRAVFWLPTFDTALVS